MLQRRFDLFSLIDKCDLTLEDLFNDSSERQAFMGRLRDFLAADRALPKIVDMRRGRLVYESESFIPPRLAHAKPNLFFVVGNPTPQSVVLRAMYAHEGHREERQHRFWKVMHSTGVLRFSQDGPDKHRPAEKMQRLYAGVYESPFNVHIVPFFSLASPPGGEWGGVAGLRRLFGQQFWDVISAERAAVRGLIDARARPGDCVLVLQRDAYMALRQPDAPAYNGSLLRKGPIMSQYAVAVDLVCIPPTRLLYSHVTKTTLAAQVARATS